MHFTGTVWRPPYESLSQLLEVTAGCTHHKCKFCTLYDDLPFNFKLSPLDRIEADLCELKRNLFSYKNDNANRIYLVGGNPFVLSFNRLKQIANLIKKYIPECQSFGCFARVTDITLKTDDELKALSNLGYDGLTIGVETGDDEILDFMNKGYTSKDIIIQSHRLDKANIKYNYFYLAGLSGFSNGISSAIKTAKVFNKTNPRIIGSSMLTIDPSSDLYYEVQEGNWIESSEVEKLEELKALINNLNIPAFFATLGASNAIHVQGKLPKDKSYIDSYITQILNSQIEDKLERYRKQLKHL